MNKLGKKDKNNQLTITITKNDYFKGINFLYMKNIIITAIILFIIVNIVVVIGLNHNLNTKNQIIINYIKILPIILIFIVLYSYHKIYKLKKKLDKAFEKIKATKIEQKFFYEKDSINVTFFNKQKIKYKWSDIIKLNESKEYFFIFISKNKWFLIPKNNDTYYFIKKIKEKILL